MAIGAVAGLGALATLTERQGDASRPGRRGERRPAPVRFVPATSVQGLQHAAAHAVIPEAPLDDLQEHAGSGLIVHPRITIPLFDGAGRPFAVIGPAHPGGQTWLPVVERQPGWVRVLLPIRPDGATGWLDAARMTTVVSRHEIGVYPEARRLDLLRDGQPIFSWTISTPGLALRERRTFLLTTVRRTPHTAPVLIRLGTHAMPDEAVLVTLNRQPAEPGRTHGRGCIHLPEAAMSALGAALPGCLVRIHAR
ncbi:hypothetical protein [Actinoplanes sp. NPDC051411]|uniref:hypothetical protein n=1 Tax=Actinoplanes sp. NPDC051411 TaxID=3155522 RepID=UPI003428B51C